MYSIIFALILGTGAQAWRWPWQKPDCKCTQRIFPGFFILKIITRYKFATSLVKAKSYYTSWKSLKLKLKFFGLQNERNFSTMFEISKKIYKRYTKMKGKMWYFLSTGTSVKTDQDYNLYRANVSFVRAQETKFSGLKWNVHDTSKCLGDNRFSSFCRHLISSWLVG